MISYYPEHVQIMFRILEFSNLDIQIFSDLFKQLISIDGIELPSYNSRFFENGIENPLFLSNCSSILFSLLLSVTTLLTLVSIYYLAK
jgi:hypothetical protein